MNAPAEVILASPGRSWRSGLTEAQRRMCPSCGSDGGGILCPRCGRPLGLGPNESSQTGLGEVFVHKRMLIAQHVVRIGRGSGTSRVVGRNGKIIELPDAELSAPVAAPPVLALVLAPSGGLMAWIAARRSGLTEEEFPEDVLIAAAADASASDLFHARRLGQDLVTLGLTDLLGALTLSPTETAWLALVGAARWGDPTAALVALTTLPAQGYRCKVALIARLWPWLRGMDVAEQLRPHLAPYYSDDPLASALLALSADAVRVETGTALITAVAACIGVDIRSGTPLGASHSRVDDRSTAAPGVGAGTHDRLLHALDPQAPSTVAFVDDVTALSRQLSDDLIDLGRFPIDALTRLESEHRRYLSARLAPGGLADDDISQLGFVEEQTRRALLRRDVKTLDALSAHPAARHARSLVSIVHRRHDDVDVESVEHAARPIVLDMVHLCAGVAAGDGAELFLTDRLIADTSVWDVIHQIVPTDQLRPTEAMLTCQPAFAEWVSLMNARELLYRGRWTDAATSARTCLQLAKDEAVRDEALNLLGCALYQQGDADGAIAALEKAIEGAYSESLLANIGVVAADLRPELAAAHLGTLAREAPTLALKLAAVRRIVSMWSNNVTTHWEGSSEAADFPTVVREPVRAVFVEAIPLNDFRQLAFLLAKYDQKWLASAPLQGSPNAGSLEARFYLAKAEGLAPLVDAMASVKAGESAPDWFDREISDFTSELIDQVVDDLVNDVTERPGVAELALSLSDRVARLDTLTDAKLLFAGSALLLDCFFTTHTLASDAMTTRLARGRALLQRLQPDARAIVQPMCSLAHKKLGLNFAVGSIRELDAMIDRVNDLADRFRRTQDINVLNHKQTTARQVAQSAAKWRERISDLIVHIDDMDARQLLETRVGDLRRIETEAWGLA